MLCWAVLLLYRIAIKLQYVCQADYMHTPIALPKPILCDIQIYVLLLSPACPHPAACNPADHLPVFAHLPSAVLLENGNLQHHFNSLASRQKSKSLLWAIVPSL